MKEVCVITGGGSGMGLATAKYIKDRLVIISGRTESKLAAACEELKEAGVEAIYKTCDTSSRASVAELAKFASEQGTIKQVINCAGMSPSMTNAEKLFRINAMGTVYVNQEFAKYMDRGSVICDVASNSAYALPGFMTKAVKFAYKWADKDEDKFVNFFMKLAGKISDDYMSAGMAYSFSKNFVTWYAAKSAFDLGPRGIRVCSVSPGLIATAMGNAEVEHGGDLIKKNCEERMGTAEELGYCIATCADPRNGYLAAVDVLADGGSTRGNAEFKHDPLAPLKMMGIIKD
ncbi:MAG: SDR family NAD(P)-dependent oxidoreductase [Acutalibacteraceae bacterium]|nr:SDR family NAD(P)-dependent oxidoreductase [Acutalibacteraceae bacterium]